jgi:hypothetical protein
VAHFACRPEAVLAKEITVYRRTDLSMRHGSTFAPALSVFSLVLVGWTGAGIAAEPLDDRLGIRTVPIMLLLRSDVQADLKLDAQQVTLCYRAARTLYERARALKGQTGQGADAARREIDQKQNEALRRTLNPEQVARLKQIDLQWEGASAMLSRPLLDDSLNLTPEQKETVSKLVSEARSRQTMRPPNFDEHTELTRNAIAVLTDRQKELWIGVLGQPCRFSVGGQVIAPAAARIGATDRPAQGAVR